MSEFKIVNYNFAENVNDVIIMIRQVCVYFNLDLNFSILFTLQFGMVIPVSHWHSHKDSTSNTVTRFVKSTRSLMVSES